MYLSSVWLWSQLNGGVNEDDALFKLGYQYNYKLHDGNLMALILGQE